MNLQGSISPSICLTKCFQYKDQTLVPLIREFKSRSFDISTLNDKVIITKAKAFVHLKPHNKQWIVNGKEQSVCEPIFFKDELVITSSCFEQVLKFFKFEPPLVVIDPGHGGNDHGTVHAKTREKSLSLWMAKLIEEEAKRRKKIHVVLTREKDEYLDLGYRTYLANKLNAKALVSIHFNSNPHKTVKGLEVYILHKARLNSKSRKNALESNSVLSQVKNEPEYVKEVIDNLEANGFYSKSSELARIVGNHLERARLTKSRGIFEAPFSVLHFASMPAILLELGFLSNPQERLKWKNEMFAKTAAKSVVSALEKFFELNPPSQ